MEKASSKSSSTTSPPSATACDVLKPLSQNGNFPNSGAVANKAREQMAKNGNSSPASSAAQPRSGSETQSTPSASGTASVQRRSESVQQMRQVDGDGVRTWRRLVVEYN
ncbi:hypothetical protein PENSTE_c035G04835 [Penicillium steckii]|uniref:Uncharacterized protein n=1 Tax=Penicillium steckii TaxID=303698 RepID=A0A1V6SKP9_9EURO|nr:hypothetical protein PENSTE_c035G04835 [Penicillium steckii]